MSQFTDRFDTKVLTLCVKIVDKADSFLDASNVSCAIVPLDADSIVDDAPDGVAGAGSARDGSAGVGYAGIGSAGAVGHSAAEPSTDPAAYGPVGSIDWDELNIQPLTVEGGTFHVTFDEDEVYELLGLESCDVGGEAIASQATSSQHPADIPVSDDVDVEPNRDWDRDDPIMDVRTIYPNMVEFRMAVRQNEEFELGTEKSDPSRFRGFCCANGCPWRIVTKTQHDKTIRVQIKTNKHECTSTSRVLGRMASQAWVTDRAAAALRKKLSYGAKELQNMLENRYKVQIPYATIWKGRERAIHNIWGAWSDSFDSLYNFKAEIELRCPGSLVEVGTKEIDGQVHFERFFCCFEPCVRGFLLGCGKYLSIDSTAFNGKWNGHMAAANALDGHNWMYPVALGFFDAETTENWTWFMEQLAVCVGNVEDLAICTDACKGLENAVKRVFPNCEKRK
ncbi:hypothetical protein E2562_001444 [Oryza meyeriana var. granulata]|uniref:Transposase MuDR plant domain-containing protein n=1 Tax=Oryza meyeriana var. granulata TaxID=110450 RepID=A0A6G1DCV6_9ORYZ|nr:hypothetical protein E2562_001444 [Oryza meyeriana var. granulata]KAF0910257.1 hypothetical protein E2562_001444 [Oryza meyeriana var. granulata]